MLNIYFAGWHISLQLDAKQVENHNWINAGFVHWHIYTILGLNELMEKIKCHMLIEYLKQHVIYIKHINYIVWRTFIIKFWIAGQFINRWILNMIGRHLLNDSCMIHHRKWAKYQIALIFTNRMCLHTYWNISTPCNMCCYIYLMC